MGPVSGPHSLVCTEGCSERAKYHPNIGMMECIQEYEGGYLDKETHQYFNSCPSKLYRYDEAANANVCVSKCPRM